ncbi:MAG: hypothetical protein M1820_005499 [Bogoriella megaspora]|nr:MAG: hypothetical protein M1820_005499 [Bogoriella megaspora]
MNATPPPPPPPPPASRGLPSWPRIPTSTGQGGSHSRNTPHQFNSRAPQSRRDGYPTRRSSLTPNVADWQEGFRPANPGSGGKISPPTHLSIEDATAAAAQEIQRSTAFFAEFLREFDRETEQLAEYANGFDPRILGDLWTAKIHWNNQQARRPSLRASANENTIAEADGDTFAATDQEIPSESFRTIAKNLYRALKTAHGTFMSAQQHSRRSGQRQNGNAGSVVEGRAERVAGQYARVERLFGPAMGDPGFMTAFLEELEILARFLT